MIEFEAQYQSEYYIDSEYEMYVLAWVNYHKVADLVDGHFELGSYAQRMSAGKASREGFKAMGDGVKFHAMQTEERKEKFNRAKSEALRRLKL